LASPNLLFLLNGQIINFSVRFFLVDDPARRLNPPLFGCLFFGGPLFFLGLCGPPGIPFSFPCLVLGIPPSVLGLPLGFQVGTFARHPIDSDISKR